MEKTPKGNVWDASLIKRSSIKKSLWKPVQSQQKKARKAFSFLVHVNICSKLSIKIPEILLLVLNEYNGII